MIVKVSERVPEERRPIVVLGSGGMLGTAIRDILTNLGRDFVGLRSREMDITKKKQVDAVLKDIQPGVIINAAAYTNVDGAETDKQLAFDINSKGAGNVAKAASMLGIFVVHISTDYVFDGTKNSPYLPDDATNPLGIYGSSKLEGERLVRMATVDHLIIRTSWLFGSNGKNFVHTMLDVGKSRPSVNVVNDQTGSPTYTRHLAKAIMDLLDRKVTGTWHLSNAGHCTWCTLAKEIFRQSGMAVDVNPVKTEVFPRPAPRPQKSVLDCSATYRVLGGPLPTWQEALREYLEEIETIEIKE
jgi:dTDP-4-dehydrorhamnose reductase